MKLRITCLLTLLLLIISFSLAEAYPQYEVLNTPYRLSNGGPFLIDPLGPGADFYTFCLEKTEYLNLNGTYYGTVDPIVIYGGGDINNSDPLNINTRKLYDYTLDNWAALIADPQAAQKLTDIQIAIWAYQGETGPPSPGSNWYYDNAPSFTLDRSIMVLNLWTGDVQGDEPFIGNADAFRKKAQSQLIEVPEPGILILLGIGLSSVAFLARRKRETL
jgi:hypothetical protein